MALNEAQETRVARWLEEALPPDRPVDRLVWNRLHQFLGPGGELDGGEADPVVRTLIQSELRRRFSKNYPPHPPPLEIMDLSGGDLGGLELIEFRDSGSFGWVFLAEKPGKADFAVKFQPLDREADLEVFRSEESVLWKFRPRGFQHSALLPIQDSGVVKVGERQFGWYSMDWLPDATNVLNHVIVENPDLKSVLDLLWPAAEALSRIHQEGIVHGDIAPKNLLVSSGKLLVTDFGLARRAGSRQLGTMDYYPIEDLACFERAADLRAFCRVMGQCLGLDPDPAVDRTRYTAAFTGKYHPLREIIGLAFQRGPFTPDVSEIMRAMKPLPW